MAAESVGLTCRGPGAKPDLPLVAMGICGVARFSSAANLDAAL